MVRATVLVAATIVGLAGCAPVSSVNPFPADAVPDYQLGGAYDPPDGVTVVARDSTASPAPGVYSICYLNGFQTQPGAAWPDHLLVQGADGPITDPDWPDENILDVSTPEQRREIVDRIEPLILGCAEAGFDAVEFDNLESYTRSDGAFGLEEAVAAATALVAIAHRAGLAAGQKNTAELGERGRDEVGFDFAVVEECDQFSECAEFTDVYGVAVIDIEYTDALRRPFDEVCADPATPAATVLRDRGLAAPGDPAYEYTAC